jgi:hypothetical protein
MPASQDFLDGCSCHVWAIDGWYDGARASLVNNRYTTRANQLLMNPEHQNKSVNEKVADLVRFSRGNDATLTNMECDIYGGFQVETDGAPEHMWFIVHNLIYDTMPGQLLRRKISSNRYHPPSEVTPFPANRVGVYNSVLTQSQWNLINLMKNNDEVLPLNSTALCASSIRVA